MDEELACSKATSQDITTFDHIIGHIEDIVVEDEFQGMQLKFMDKYYNEFEDSEENKLCYTPIFNEYVNMLEKHIEHELLKRVKSFNMSEFMSQLNNHKEDVSEELVEMLLSFTDFLTFKQIMVDHKDFRLGNVVDLSLGLTVTSLKANDELPPSATQ